jgi:hypothetical protein
VAQDNEKSTLAKVGPVGAAIAILAFGFPPPPKVLLFDWSKAFPGIGAFGLLIGLAFGLYITNKHGRLQPKRKGALTIALLASVFLLVAGRYFQIVGNAENHFPETVVGFFAINILIGILLFLVAPAIKLVRDAFVRHE